MKKKKTKIIIYEVDSILEEIIGQEKATMSEIIKLVFEYITVNKLQGVGKDNSLIRTDKKLKQIFGKEPFSIYELNRYLFHHISLDKRGEKNG